MEQNLGTKRSASKGSGQIATKSHEAGEQLKEAVVSQANQVRGKVESAQRGTSERIRGVATQLENIGEALAEDDPFVAKLAQRASRGVEDMVQYVSQATPQSIVRDTESFARRQPALFFGGAFLLGLAAGRFLKTSAPPDRARGRDGEAARGSAGREQRTSGFYSPSEGAGRSELYSENYRATFDPDSNERDFGGIEPRASVVPQPDEVKIAGGAGSTRKGSLP